jgi:hypothetical protein
LHHHLTNALGRNLPYWSADRLSEPVASGFTVDELDLESQTDFNIVNAFAVFRCYALVFTERPQPLILRK